MKAELELTVVPKPQELQLNPTAQLKVLLQKKSKRRHLSREMGMEVRKNWNNNEKYWSFLVRNCKQKKSLGVRGDSCMCSETEGNPGRSKVNHRMGERVFETSKIASRTV